MDKKKGELKSKDLTKEELTNNKINDETQIINGIIYINGIPLGKAMEGFSIGFDEET